MILHISPRKILHNYAIPIFATVVFIVLFVGLWAAHQYALASVGDLAASNPLIVSDKSKLVSNDQSTDPIIEQFSDSSATAGSPSVAGGSTSGTTGSQGQSGSSSSRPSTSGGSTGGSTPTKPATPQAPFAVSLGSIEDHSTRISVRRTLLGIILGCTVDHQFKIAVGGQNGPGTLKYRWVKSTGGDPVVEQKAFPAGNSSIDLTSSMTTSSWGDYWITLEVLSPSVMEKKYTFSHRC